MFTSLFGDLSAPAPKAQEAQEAKSGDAPAAQPAPGSHAQNAASAGFAATTLAERVETDVNAQGQMVDSHLLDLVVTGSPAQAIREHFARTLPHMGGGVNPLITLLDPIGIWASAVIKALSDAGGQPIERMHLREHATLRTLAMIERTKLVRRGEEPIKIYHADVRAPGPENAEIPVALMERGHLTVVILGAMQPHAIDALLASLCTAARSPTWHCPHTVFMLQPGMQWMATKIGDIEWPQHVSVHVLHEAMTSASAVWNAMLDMWNQVKTLPPPHPRAFSMAKGNYPIRVVDFSPATETAEDLNTLASVSKAEVADAPDGDVKRAVLKQTPDAAVLRFVLQEVMQLEGLLGCAIVDEHTGQVLAFEEREYPTDELEMAAAHSSRLLSAHRLCAAEMGLHEAVDELVLGAGHRQLLVRVLQPITHTFTMALLDKRRTNLALVRFKLMELERRLIARAASVASRSAV
jgi:predicted regulator of Ras-like GTPase activity (Roadblock/LC7/MglB family)